MSLGGFLTADTIRSKGDGSPKVSSLHGIHFGKLQPYLHQNLQMLITCLLSNEDLRITNRQGYNDLNL